MSSRCRSCQTRLFFNAEEAEGAEGAETALRMERYASATWLLGYLATRLLGSSASRLAGYPATAVEVISLA